MKSQALGIPLTMTERRGLLTMLRDARSSVLRDSESFHQAASILEHVGQVLSGQLQAGLGKYKSNLCTLALDAPRIHHARIEHLFETVRIARNDAVHGGSFIRHQASRLVELILVLEEALMTPMTEVRDLMVVNPVTAELWHNIATIRRTMLANAFSCLPFRDDKGIWYVLSDYSLVAFLKDVSLNLSKNERLSLRLGEAIAKAMISVDSCVTCDPSAEISSIVAKTQNRPVLVVEDHVGEKRLVGILTSFDLL